jgi:UPF0271 protein
MRYVLDTSALLSGKDLPADSEMYTSPKILEELKHGRMRRRLDFLIESGLRVVSPSEGKLKEVLSAAERSGDISRVSEADMEILGLAMELEATLLTDDYSIQNLASILGVDYKGISQDEIKETRKWRIRCKGCGRFWDTMHPSCPVCGSELKTTR